MLAPGAAGRCLSTVAGHMSSVAGTTHCELPDSPHRRRLQRLLGVSGCGPNRVNDLLLLRPESDGESGSGTNNRHVVFFHGDIQNFKEQMVLQPEAAQWLSWSLEQVALILGQRFPSSNIWVVKASRMYLHKFSCYQNFVDCNMFGAPEHAPYSAERGAFAQLRTLLSNAMERARLPGRLQPAGGAAGLPAGFSLSLVGFSKGCVVLNQLVYELAGARADPRAAAFVERISDMFWLDGGHPGGSETWVTDEAALRALAASGVSVHAHVTPYEVRDPARAWVGREYGVFTRTLEELGACPSKKLHFEEEPPSIQNHFRVILEF